MKNRLNLKGVSVETWARTIVLLIALAAQFCIISGRSEEEINIEQWQNYVTYALTVIASVWSWWKNNSFTSKAQQADKYLHSESDYQ